MDRLLGARSEASAKLQQAFRDAGEGKHTVALVAASEVMATLHGTVINIIDHTKLGSEENSGFLFQRLVIKWQLTMLLI